MPFTLPSAPVIERYAGSRNAYLPRHIPRNEVQTLKRVAVILPFSSTNPEVQKTTQGLYNAIQMALFEASVRNGTVGDITHIDHQHRTERREQPGFQRPLRKKHRPFQKTQIGGRQLTRVFNRGREPDSSWTIRRRPGTQTQKLTRQLVAKLRIVHTSQKIIHPSHNFSSQ